MNKLMNIFFSCELLIIEYGPFTVIMGVIMIEERQNDVILSKSFSASTLTW